MKLVFGNIGIIAIIIDVILLILGLPMAAIIDLGGNVDIKFFTKYVKVIGILLVVIVISSIIALL